MWGEDGLGLVDLCALNIANHSQSTLREGRVIFGQASPDYHEGKERKGTTMARKRSERQGEAWYILGDG